MRTTTLTTVRHMMFAAAALATLSGCTKALSIGSPEYACAGMPEGVTCISARNVYTATESDDYQTQLMKEQEFARTGKKPGKDNADSDNNNARVLYSEQAANAPMPIRAQNPLPIRTQAVVMRIAVDPWEDEKGDLYVPGYIYTEVEPRRWEIGARNQESRTIITPLRSQH